MSEKDEKVPVLAPSGEGIELEERMRVLGDLIEKAAQNVDAGLSARTRKAYASQWNNNGSAFAGYGATEFSALIGTVALWLGRFVPLVAALALAGSLASKRAVPASAGTFRTDGGTFGVLLVMVVLLTAVLMIFPALTLGPIVEALS